MGSCGAEHRFYRIGQVLGCCGQENKDSGQELGPRIVNRMEDKADDRKYAKLHKIITDKEDKELDFVSFCVALVYNGHKSNISGLRRYTCPVTVIPGQTRLKKNFSEFVYTYFVVLK